MFPLYDYGQQGKVVLVLTKDFAVGVKKCNSSPTFMKDKIIQIQAYAYVDVDGGSHNNVYGLSESGILYSWRNEGWQKEEESPEKS